MKIINSNIFALRGTNKRFIHLATIQDGFREYTHFYDSWTGQAYIEELTGGRLFFIKDDDKWIELDQFLADNGVHHCQRVSMTDDIWRKHPLAKKYYTPICQDIMKMPVSITKK